LSAVSVAKKQIKQVGKMSEIRKDSAKMSEIRKNFNFEVVITFYENF